MLIAQHTSLEILFLISLLSFVNGGILSMVFASWARLRRNRAARVAVLIYVGACVWAYSTFIPPPEVLREATEIRLGPILSQDEVTRSTIIWFYLVAVCGYLPVVVYVLASTVDMAMHRLLRRGGNHESRLQTRWRSRLLRVTRFGSRRLLDAKCAQLQHRRTDPRLRRELIDLYLKVGDDDFALYHAYALVELLPRGHSHGFALYRLCHILVDRSGRLDAAQPYLRRILRLYPRSFFASYARRLINQYEAYADREV